MENLYTKEELNEFHKWKSKGERMAVVKHI